MKPTKTRTEEYIKGFEDGVERSINICADRIKVWKKWKATMGESWKEEIKAFIYLKAILQSSKSDERFYKRLQKLEDKSLFKA